jgi:hypothetical protein
VRLKCSTQSYSSDTLSVIRRISVAGATMCRMRTTFNNVSSNKKRLFVYEAVDKSSGHFRDATVARQPRNSINSTTTNSQGYMKLIQVKLETLMNILLLVFFISLWGGWHGG